MVAVGVTVTGLSLGAVFFTLEADEDALQAALALGPSGPLGSSSSQHRRTLEVVLQKSHASFRITSGLPVERSAESGSRGGCPNGPNGSKGDQAGRKLLPFGSRQPP